MEYLQPRGEERDGGRARPSGARGREGEEAWGEALTAVLRGASAWPPAWPHAGLLAAPNGPARPLP